MSALQTAWDASPTLPPIIFAGHEADALIAALAQPAPPPHDGLLAENDRLRADIRHIQRNTATYRQDARKEADAAIQRAVQADKRAADFAEANRRMLAMIEAPPPAGLGYAEGRIAGLEEAARIVDAEYNLRKQHHVANKQAGNKKEARDFETMMIAHTQSSSAIRTLANGEPPPTA